MNRKISRVALLTNPKKDAGYVCFRQTLDYLLSLGLSVYVPDDLSEALPGENKAICVPDGAELYRGAECAVVLGGDGTLLSAARDAVPENCPMLGVNLGRMGYMAELEPDEYRILSRLVSGEYGIEERMTLSVSVETDGERRVFCPNALNDAVISHGENQHVVDLRLYCDASPVSAYRGNGLIISTPTGSTAYAMAAGGPVLDPVLRCTCVVPICPVSPAAKPMVFSGENTMTVENLYEREDSVLLTVDGRSTARIPHGGKVFCTGAMNTAKLIKLKDNKFYSVLRAKIN